MAYEEVGLRLSLQGRREAAAGLKEVKSELADTGDEAQTAGRKAGLASRGFAALERGASRGFGAVSRGVAGILRAGGRVGLTGIAAGIGLVSYALTKGFSRLNSIDQATAKLSGLGNSAGRVDKIMANALASVRGTAFGLDEAATVSASAVAAGIKPGRDLTKTLKLVADAATIGGTTLGEMGSIFNKVAASNKLQGDTIAQLNDRGIPILQLLGKQLGKTSEEVTEMASKGKIDFATFRKAMDAGLGGAALKSGNTAAGAFANVKASLGRIGAGLGGKTFSYVPEALSRITTALGPLEDMAGRAGDKIGAKLGPALLQIGPGITKVVSWAQRADFTKLTKGLHAVRDYLSDIDWRGLSTGSSSSGGSLRKMGDAIAGVDWAKLKDSLGDGVNDSLSVFSVLIGFAADHVDTLAKAMPFLVTGFIAYKSAQAAANVLALASIPLRTIQAATTLVHTRALNANTAQLAIANGVEQVGLVTRVRSTVATVASTVATKAAAAASKVWAVGQWILNAALSANPIALVVIGIAALVAGFILAYKHSETFRKIVDATMHGVAAAVGWVVDFVKAHWQLLFVILTGPVGAAVLLIAKHWDTITGALGSAIGFIRDHWKLILGILTGPIGAAVILIATHWQEIKDGALSAVGYVGDQFHAAHVRLARIAGGIKDTLLAPFKAVYDFIVTLITEVQSLIDKLKSIPGGDGSAHKAGGVPLTPRAAGGPVWPGRPYVVGEHQPELFVPDVAGTILPRVPTVGMPDLPAMEDGELQISGGMNGQPIVIQLLLDGKVISETVLDHTRTKVARQ